MGWYWIIFAVIVAPLIFNLVRQWILLPLKMKQTNPMRIRRAREATDAEGLTPEFQEFMGQRLGRFRELGFEAASNNSSRDSIPGFRTVQVLLVHRAAGDVATIGGVWGKQKRNLTIRIGRRLESGQRVSVSYSQVIPLLPRDPEDDSLRVAWVDDPRVLYESHRRRLAVRGLERMRGKAPDRGAEEAWLDEIWDREQARMVRIGYRYRDEAAGVLRFTYKGAYLSSWKSMEPVKRWRAGRLDRRARKEWRELGMDDWTPEGDQATTTSLVAANASRAKTEAPPADRASDSIGYAIPLRDSEVRVERGQDLVVVRIGGKTLGQYLLSHWATLVWIVVNAGFGGFYLLYWRLMLRANPTMPGIDRTCWMMFVMFACALAGAGRLVHGAVRRRGVAEVRAGREGLMFRNAPAGERSGRLGRSEVESVRVIKVLAGLNAYFRLQVRSHRAVQILMISRDAKGLLDARREIVTAMGIETGDDEQESPSAVATG